jgi:hypothetical protein
MSGAPTTGGKGCYSRAMLRLVRLLLIVETKDQAISLQRHSFKRGGENKARYDID